MEFLMDRRKGRLSLEMGRWTEKIFASHFAMVGHPKSRRTIFVALLAMPGMHGDGILVPSPPIPTDFTPILTRPRTDSDPSPAHPRKKFDPSPQAPAYFFCQPKAVITVTIVAILKIPHSAALTVNFKL